MGTTKVKALDPKAEGKSEWLFTEKSTDGKEWVFQCLSVVSVKENPRKHWEHYVPSVLLQAFSDEIETLRATDPKADLGPIYQNYDFMQSLYAGERSARYATAEATKDIVISV
jgi:hypothetical protein